VKHELIKLKDIPPSGSKIVPFFGKELHVYLNDGKPKAVANVCLHFGGPLECKEGKLVCAWHNASFDMSTGERLEGPSPKGSKLLTISTRVEDNALHYVWGE
jgi:nitrite reductase/ring-hydroxylating ferredoxin subunit